MGGVGPGTIGATEVAARLQKPNPRLPAERMLTRGFVMLSYKQVYGDRQYRQFAAARRAAAEQARASATVTVPAAAAESATATASPAAM